MTTKSLLEASHLPIKFIVDVQGVFRKYMSPYIDIIYILISKSNEETGQVDKNFKTIFFKINKYHARASRMIQNISCDNEKNSFCECT